MLRLDNVSKSYDSLIFEDICAEVPGGQALCLRGSNGSGKSTVLACLAGLLPFDSGTVSLDGEEIDVTDPRVQRRFLALVGEAPWMPGFTVFDHLLLLAGGDESLAADISERLWLEPFQDRLPRQLSSGQWQRASLAPLLVGDWDVLLLDEPERHLDDDAIALVAQLVTEQLTPRRVALVATHSPALEQALPGHTLRLGE